jgi:phage repressor protein C with HTH and peptisase S24 domain
MTAMMEVAHEVADDVAGPAFYLPPCRDEWVYRNIRDRSADLAFFEVRGSSPFEQLHKGDIVVINRDQTDGPDGIYAILHYRDGRPCGTVIRRLQFLVTGGVQEVSTGKTFLPEETAHVVILGRIVWPRML